MYLIALPLGSLKGHCPLVLHSQGSEAAYIYGCIILCSIPLLLTCAAYGVVKLMNSRRRKMKQIREELNNNSGPGRKQGRTDSIQSCREISRALSYYFTLYSANRIEYC